MSIDRGNVRRLVRAIAYDARGSRLGRVAQVFIDDRTDEPAWVAVDVTRTRGMRLLPLAGAGLKGRHLVIRAERSTVRSAPRIDLGDGQLSSQDEARLLEHYGLTPAGGGGAPESADRRPASPWPDDTERETAWERPAQQGYAGHDTQAIAPGWEQRTGAAAATTPAPTDQSSTDQRLSYQSRSDQPRSDQPNQGSGEIGDRGASREAGIATPAPVSGATAQPRDTAPRPVTPAPSPARPAPESHGSAPASPTR